ncbi:hypothetical protein PAPYR_5950 [Paratrimastix pyriformis]|uniref:Uncharacterized protein n=1 Tax=Paratrimastix pyriformis TaxID=342808 RepID=A0ABQ8UHW6_9EUKA|nr:hypothetical protein PAPYR_5950 [Paratrimastix pyriformis]
MAVLETHLLPSPQVCCMSSCPGAPRLGPPWTPTPPGNADLTAHAPTGADYRRVFRLPQPPGRDHSLRRRGHDRLYTKETSVLRGGGVGLAGFGFTGAVALVVWGTGTVHVPGHLHPLLRRAHRPPPHAAGVSPSGSWEWTLTGRTGDGWGGGVQLDPRTRPSPPGKFAFALGPHSCDLPQTPTVRTALPSALPTRNCLFCAISRLSCKRDANPAARDSPSTGLLPRPQMCAPAKSLLVIAGLPQVAWARGLRLPAHAGAECGDADAVHADPGDFVEAAGRAGPPASRLPCQAPLPGTVCDLVPSS